MDALSPEILAVLAMVAALAGFVDAIAGGGGLLALPALLWAGLPPLQALATNKLQGSFGTLTATVHHVRHGGLKLRALWPAVLLTFLGAGAGTLAKATVHGFRSPADCSRDTIREAFSRGVIADGDTWMKMLVDRNRTSHTYNEKIANEILQNIDQMYVAELVELEDKLYQLAMRDQ